MNIRQWMVEYIDSQPWDADARQDIFVKLLQMEEQDIDENFLSRMHTNYTTDKVRVENRRREIEAESFEYIKQALGWADESADPMAQMMAEEELKSKLKELSPILRATLERVVINGESPADMAAEEGIEPNVIYQRVHEAKRQIKGETQ